MPGGRRVSRESVVLVHGLWTRGHEFAPMRGRLARAYGYDVHVFSYPTLRGDADTITGDLQRLADRLAADGPVHFVGHSLGGRFVHRLLDRVPGRYRGNAVVLGSPLSGCRAAEGVSRFRLLRPMIGPHLLAEVTAPAERRWEGPGAFGSIAGTRHAGSGQLFTRFDEPHDGTVAVSETRIPGLDDHLEVEHGHMALVFAREVTDQVAHFLRHRRFQH